MSENLRRCGYCLRLPPYDIEQCLNTFSICKNPEYENRFLLQLIFKKLSARFTTPYFPRTEKKKIFCFLKGTLSLSIYPDWIRIYRIDCSWANSAFLSSAL